MNAPWNPDYDPQTAKDDVLCFAHEVEVIGKKYHLPILLIIGLPKQQATVFFHAGLSDASNRAAMEAGCALALEDAEKRKDDQ